MNFSNFCENTPQEKIKSNFNENKKNYSKNAENLAKISQNTQNFEDFYTKEQKQNIENRLSKYKDMTEIELKNELVREANKQKQNGNLDAKKLEELKNSISPMLNEEQAQRLENLIKMLK